MNVAVLGKSRMNETVKRQLAQEGILPYVFEDVSDVLSVSGEKGSFLIKSRSGGNLEAAYIVITEEPAYAGDKAPGNGSTGRAITLEDDAAQDGIPFSKTPVVFILDYPEESPAYMTRMALEKAIRLVKRKRKVVYLSRFMRTAGEGLEQLFKDARSLGVVFCKYEDISMEYSQEMEVFHIRVKDGYGGLDLVTHTPVLAGSKAYSEAFSKIIKLLKLKADQDGYINEDSFYLFPSSTSRRGIYFVHKKASTAGSEELASQLQYVLNDIRNRDGVPEEKAYARIDAGKCAFCYTCFRACPHAAMAPDYENSVMKNLKSACAGCGICASVCPAGAVTMVCGTEETRPVSGRLKLYCCENSGAIAFERLKADLQKVGFDVEAAVVSCGGELSAEVLLSALGDHDRVLVVVCLAEACRHYEGNKRALRSVERAREMLRASGVDESRITYLQLSHAMPAVLDETIRDLTIGLMGE